MSDAPDYGRLKRLIAEDTGYDSEALLRELEKLPRAIYGLRKKLQPLKSELKMLTARYDSKGRSPSHFDLKRSLLLSELKEEIRDEFEREGKKITDGRAEDKAHASLRYRKFLEEAEADWRRIGELNREISKLFDKIEVWRGVEKHVTQAIETARAHVYSWNAEAKNVR